MVLPYPRFLLLLTLKSSGTLSSLLRGGPKRGFAAALVVASAWYAGGAWVYSMWSSGSDVGAAWYLAVDAIFLFLFCPVNTGLAMPEGISTGYNVRMCLEKNKGGWAMLMMVES